MVAEEEGGEELQEGGYKDSCTGTTSEKVQRSKTN